jgi:hypothetical protein
MIKTLEANDLRFGRNMATIQLFLLSMEQMVVRRGQIRRIGWMMTLEVQVSQFLLGCKCPVSQGIVVQEQDPFGDLPMHGVFPSKGPSVAPAEMSNTTPLEDNQQRGCRLDTPKKIEARTFPADCTRNILGQGEPLFRHSIDFCFVSGS